MRVTNTMMNKQLVSNLNRSFSKMDKLQNHLSTGSKILRPGDDPVGLTYVMRYNSEMSRNDEYMKNVDTGIGWLREMDSLMQQASDILKRAKTLTQQASTGTTPEDAREAIAIEIKHLKEQMVMIGNSTFAGRYMFNGQKTDQAPYNADTAATDQTDKGMFQLNVAQGVAVPISITGEDIFGKAGDDLNVFKVLDDIYTHLQNNEQDGILAGITKIEEVADQISSQWSEMGARMNRFELVANRIGDQQLHIEALRSEINDVNYAETITELKMQESVHQAALGVGARIIQPSLMDFLR